MVQAQYTWGTGMGGGIGGLLARTVGTPAHHYFYHYDGGGNVVALTNSSQQVVARYQYGAYGNLVASGLVTGDATLTDTTDQAQQNANPFRFSTKWQHSTSGLYDYGFRFYSPGLARFINRDPIQEDGGLNLYGFVGNDPINDIDFDGTTFNYNPWYPPVRPWWDLPGRLHDWWNGPDTGPEIGPDLAMAAEHTKRRGSKKRTNDQHTKRDPGDPEKGDKYRSKGKKTKNPPTQDPGGKRKEDRCEEYTPPWWERMLRRFPTPDPDDAPSPNPFNNPLWWVPEYPVPVP